MHACVPRARAQHGSQNSPHFSPSFSTSPAAQRNTLLVFRSLCTMPCRLHTQPHCSCPISTLPAWHLQAPPKDHLRNPVYTSVTNLAVDVLQCEQHLRNQQPLSSSGADAVRTAAVAATRPSCSAVGLHLPLTMHRCMWSWAVDIVFTHLHKGAHEIRLVHQFARLAPASFQKAQTSSDGFFHDWAAARASQAGMQTPQSCWGDCSHWRCGCSATAAGRSQAAQHHFSDTGIGAHRMRPSRSPPSQNSMTMVMPPAALT
jgi:hypothetical protein